MRLNTYALASTRFIAVSISSALVWGDLLHIGVFDETTVRLEASTVGIVAARDRFSEPHSPTGSGTMLIGADGRAPSIDDVAVVDLTSCGIFWTAAVHDGICVGQNIDGFEVIVRSGLGIY